MLSGPWLGYSLAFLAAVSWAIAPVLYRRGVDHVSYMGLGALRCTGYLASAAAFLVFTMGPAAFAPPPLPMLGLVVLCSVIWLVVGDLLYFVSLHKLGVTICVPVTSAYPLIVVPASWIFLGEPVKPAVFFAALLIVGGLILLSPKGEDSGQKKQIRSGLIAAVLTMCCWTFGILTNKVLMQYMPVPQLEMWRAISVTIGSWALFLAFEGRKGLRGARLLSGKALTEMAVAGALGLTIGNLFFTYSLRYTTVDIVACIASLRPFLAAMFATFILRERLTPRLAGGIVLVMAGVVAISL